MLDSLGLECHVVNDGTQVLEQAGKEHYDLILVDCQMPEIDGYQATESIRRTEDQLDLARIPIIALTANVLPGEAERCLDGCTC